MSPARATLRLPRRFPRRLSHAVCSSSWVGRLGGQSGSHEEGVARCRALRLLRMTAKVTMKTLLLLQLQPAQLNRVVGLLEAAGASGSSPSPSLTAC